MITMQTESETRMKLPGRINPVMVDFVQAMYPKCLVFGQDVENPITRRIEGCEIVIKRREKKPA